jgi:hypothetical protein
MTRSKIIDRHGNEVHGDVVPDGGRIVVTSLMFMDANSLPKMELPAMTAQTSRYASLTDTQRNARAEMHRLRDQRIQNAWKNPSMAPVAQQQQQTAAPSAQAPAPVVDKAKMYADRDRRISEAWKDAR